MSPARSAGTISLRSSRICATVTGCGLTGRRSSPTTMMSLSPEAMISRPAAAWNIAWTSLSMRAILGFLEFVHTRDVPLVHQMDLTGVPHRQAAFFAVEKVEQPAARLRHVVLDRAADRRAVLEKHLDLRMPGRWERGGFGLRPVRAGLQLGGHREDHHGVAPQMAQPPPAIDGREEDVRAVQQVARPL